MAKYYGNIGFVETIESEPGIWKEQVVEKPYYGDITRDTRQYPSSGGVNNDVNISNNFSIIADPYANNNFQYMKYIVYMGTKWTITNIDIQYPRLVLTVGGVYND